MSVEKIKIKDFAEVISGSTPKTNIEEYWNGEYYWITPAEIKANIKYINNSERKITIKGIESCSLKELRKNTILLTSRAPIGKVALAGTTMFCNQGFKNLICNENIVKPEYIYYWLSSQKDFLNNLGRGATFKEISKKIVEEIEVPIQSLSNQSRIVEVLNKAQKLIDKRKEQIKNLDELVKSQFIGLFGDPINNPMKWEVKKMKDISTNIMSGNTPKGGEQVYVESGVMFLRSQNVWKNKLLLDDVAYIDQETHNKMKKSSLKNKDILMTKTGRINTENSSLGRAAMFLGEDNSANVNGHVYLIRLQEQAINEFVLYILTSKEYRGYIRSVCVGGIDKRQLNKEHIEDFPIIYPPVVMQEKFVSYVKQVDKLKFEMESSLKELEDNFNSLMQKAFKGELFN